MDGDIAPLEGLAWLARRYDAMLIVDEAHAIGVMGEKGGGVCRTGIDCRPDIIIGTLSKALGGYGGFVACSKVAREYLLNHAVASSTRPPCRHPVWPPPGPRSPSWAPSPIWAVGC